MIYKVIGVLQFIIIQAISAQVSNRDLPCQNALKNLANIPLVDYGRCRRQINNSPDGLPVNGNLAANGFNNGIPFKNSQANGNFLCGNGLPNNLALKNSLPNDFALNGFPNSSPNNFPFPNMNVTPQYKLLPNYNDIISNGLAFNSVPNGLPSSNNGLPGLNNVPNGLPSFNNVPSGLPAFNNGLPGLNSVPNGLPSFNNVPSGLPAFYNGLPGLNNVPNGLPSFNNVPSGLPALNNGLSGLNNVPNGLPGFNNVPSGLPAFKNGVPGLNNVPNGLPSFNNVPSGLPAFSNGLSGLNNVPNGLPSFNNVPSGIPSFNYGWPSQINVHYELPVSNNVPNGLLNLSNNPIYTNKVLNVNNVPAESNILNSNNLPAANTLSNINNIVIPNGLPSFNNLPCNNLPFGKGLPLNNLPSGNILPAINNQLPYLNNLRITEIGIGNRVADVNRFPRDNQPVVNMSPSANNLQNVNELRQQVSDELTNMNNYQNNNRFLSNANMPSTSTLPSIVPVDHRFSSVSHFPISSGIFNIANDVQNINNMQLTNDLPDISHFQNYNSIPVNEQRFVNNVPINKDFADPINFASNTGMPNANSRLVNDINNGMPLFNEGHLNDILLAKRGLPESYSQNSDGSGFPSNDFQFGNIQVPVNNWHYDFEPSKMPDNQNSLLSSNVPKEYSSVLTSNNLNLAQELVNNLQIEGLANMPFLNGLPVAGITESVTVLNGPYGK